MLLSPTCVQSRPCSSSGLVLNSRQKRNSCFLRRLAVQTGFKHSKITLKCCTSCQSFTRRSTQAVLTIVTRSLILCGRLGSPPLFLPKTPRCQIFQANPYENFYHWRDRGFLDTGGERAACTQAYDPLTFSA